MSLSPTESRVFSGNETFVWKSILCKIVGCEYQMKSLKDGKKKNQQASNKIYVEFHSNMGEEN